MADLAEQMKKVGTINRACAVYIGDVDYNSYAKSLSSFDTVYNDLDMYKPDLVSLDDARVAEIVKKYDNNIFAWNALYAERGLICIEQDIYKPVRKLSAPQGEALIIKSLHFADHWLAHSRADFIFDISALGLFRLSLLAAARYHNVPYLFHAPANIGERFAIHNDLFYRHDNITKRYNYLNTLPASDELKSRGRIEKDAVRKSKSIYKGHAAEDPKSRQSGGDNGSGNKGKSRSLFRAVFIAGNLFKEWIARRKQEKKWNNEGLINYVDDRYRAGDIWTRRWHRKRRKKENIKIINARKIDSYPELGDRPVVLYTWHVQPENSTSQLAPFHVNQDIAVQNITRVLPLNWIILIKPHRYTLDKVRPREFELIASLPNAYFANVETPTPQLIERISAVVTLTGAVGMEALAMDKPVFYLGTPSWRICKSAHHAKSYEDLGHMLRNLDEYRPNPDDVAAYFQAILDNSIELPDGYDMIRSPEKFRTTPRYTRNLELIAQQIATEFEQTTAVSDANPDPLSLK